jgi:hypothetical protein
MAEKRHDLNLKELIIENEKLEKETREKEFQKYITYYFLKKQQSLSLSKKKKAEKNKLKEKAEKLEELEHQNELKRKDLLKKMQKMDKKRKEYMKTKEDKITEYKIQNLIKTKKVHSKLNELEQEQNEKLKNVLGYQSELVGRSMRLNSINNMKRVNTQDNTINRQIAIRDSLFNFNKKLNALKSESVFKKTKEEKMKIFKELKREEAERKKKEKEDELYKQGQ